MGLFADVPIEGMLVGTTAVILAAVMAGVYVGRHFLNHFSPDEAPPVGSLVGALFALLAFLLALTYSASSSRFEDRKQLLLDEVNAIGTAYLRADFLQPEASDKSKTLLKEYIAGRAEAAISGINIEEAKRESERLQKELWQIATAAVELNGGPKELSYATALNEVFDLHTSRVIVGLTYSIQSTVWIILLVVTVLAMFSIGFQFGYSGGRRVMLCFVLALTFSLVLIMIEDLDRPFEGTIRVNNQLLLELHKSL